VFVAIKENHPDILVLAFVDDLTMTGPPRSVLSAYRQLLATMLRGMEVQPAKCCLLLPKGGLTEEENAALDGEVRELGLQSTRECLGLLGAVVGRDKDAKAAWMRNKLDAWSPTLKLASCPLVSAQLSLLLLRWMSGRPNFLCRSMEPSVTSPALDRFDYELRRHAEKRVDLPFAEHFAIAMFYMPLRMGGLGFSRNGTDSHAAMAYAAAAAALAPHIAKTPLGKMDGQVWQSLPALRALQASLDTLQATFSFEQGVEPRFPGNAEAFFEKFSKHKNAKLASGLQGYMSKRIQDASHAALHEHSTTEEKAVLNCRFCPEASAWLQAMPHTADQQLADFEIRFGVAHATNQVLPTLPHVCYCGGAVTTEHLVACPHSCGKIKRHNRMMALISRTAQQTGIGVSWNPRATFEDANAMRLCRQPDAVFYPGFGPIVWTDLAVVSDVSPSRVLRGSRHFGPAIVTKEAQKRSHYDEAAKAAGADFVPLIFDTHGRAGSAVRKFLRLLVHAAGEQSGLVASDLHMALLLELVRGNAELASETANRMRFHAAKENGARYSALLRE